MRRIDILTEEEILRYLFIERRIIANGYINVYGQESHFRHHGLYAVISLYDFTLAFFDVTHNNIHPYRVFHTVIPFEPNILKSKIKSIAILLVEALSDCLVVIHCINFSVPLIHANELIIAQNYNQKCEWSITIQHFLSSYN